MIAVCAADSGGKMNSANVAESETLARIVDAARSCFRERGVAKTRMGHIAQRAGMARQTLYHFVGFRAEIVDLAIEVRLAELAQRITATRLPARKDLRERFVDLFVLIVDVVGNDEEYGMLAGSLGEAHAFQFLAGPSALTAVAEAVFAPLFDEARRQGRLRDDVSDRLMVEWLQSMLATLAARDGLAPGYVRTLLRSRCRQSFDPDSFYGTVTAVLCGGDYNFRHRRCRAPPSRPAASL